MSQEFAPTKGEWDLGMFLANELHFLYTLGVGMILEGEKWDKGRNRDSGRLKMVWKNYVENGMAS